jgi:RNA polymerase sigma factor (sigma-70 family)
MAGARTGGALKQIHQLFVEGTAAGLSDGQLLERFLARADGAAFAALVQRHGPMVQRACRSVLPRPEDVEDAFQATFLVLVCKGRSIRGRQALEAWLGQVAHRVAVRAGVESARRRACERRAGEGRAADPHRDEPDDDWRQVLHEELSRLSDRYRLPLLLCDLECKTHAEAAAELGCGPATVQRRLTGARGLLRTRLIRRGIAPTAGVLAAALGQVAPAQVPPGWVEATVRAAESWGSRAGRLAVGEVASTAAAVLASKSLRAMMLSQLKAGAAAAVFLIALVGVVWRTGLAAQDKAGPGTAPRMQKVQAASGPSPARVVEPDGPKEILTYQGQVLDPQGKPFAGAALYLVCDRLKHPEDPPIRATSGADGRFRFEVSKSDFDRSLGGEPWSDVTLLARALGLAFGMANAEKNPGEWTLRLARDDVPISGRIIDLQGRPVAGASVTVLVVGATSNVRLDDYLKALQEHRTRPQQCCKLLCWGPPSKGDGLTRYTMRISCSSISTCLTSARTIARRVAQSGSCNSWATCRANSSNWPITSRSSASRPVSPIRCSRSASHWARRCRAAEILGSNSDLSINPSP